MRDSETQLSPKEAKDLVRTFWKALADHDLATIAPLLSDDIRWEIKYVGHYLPDNGVTVGKENCLRNNVGLFNAMYGTDLVTVDIRNMVSDGASVVMEFTIDGRTTAGARYDMVEYVTFVELENGRVKSVREYMDALKAKEAHSLN